MAHRYFGWPILCSLTAKGDYLRPARTAPPIFSTKDAPTSEFACPFYLNERTLDPPCDLVQIYKNVPVVGRLVAR